MISGKLAILKDIFDTFGFARPLLLTGRVLVGIKKLPVPFQEL
jgi:hypothetical protein